MLWAVILLSLLGVISLILVLIWFGSAVYSTILGSSFVPIKRKFLQTVLGSAFIKNKNLLIDLGSGDGRVLREGIRAGFQKVIGYELSPWQYWESKLLNNLFSFVEYCRGSISAGTAEVKLRTQVFRKNIFEADLKDADLIFIYLFPKLSAKLVPKLEEELKVGTTVLSVSYPLNLDPQKFTFIKKEKHYSTTAFCYQRI